MTKLLRIDKYTDDDKVPTSPKKATTRYISLFNEHGGIGHITEYSEDGFDLKGESPSRMYYEGDKIPELVEENDEN